MENGFSLTYVEQQESYITELRQKLQKAEAELAIDKVPCKWRRRVGGWDTQCQNLSRFRNLQWKFCPYCGHPIEVQP